MGAQYAFNVSISFSPLYLSHLVHPLWLPWSLAFGCLFRASFNLKNGSYVPIDWVSKTDKVSKTETTILSNNNFQFKVILDFHWSISCLLCSRASYPSIYSRGQTSLSPFLPARSLGITTIDILRAYLQDMYSNASRARVELSILSNILVAAKRRKRARKQEAGVDAGWRRDGTVSSPLICLVPRNSHTVWMLLACRAIGGESPNLARQPAENVRVGVARSTILVPLWRKGSVLISLLSRSADFVVV